MSQEAIKRALELAREGVEIHNENSPEYKVCAALLSIAEEEKQEPVGFIADRYNGKMSGSAYPEPMAIWINHLPPIGSVLYTTPQQRKPLTDEQIETIRQQPQHHKGEFDYEFDELSFARAIEAAHGIKE